MDAFIAQFYDNREPPKQILTSHAPPQAALLSEALTVRAGRKVEIATPQRGEKRDLTQAAAMNAREALGRRLAERSSQTKSLKRLAELLHMPTPPARIEVYDNSHIQGTNAVGAMVVAGPEGFIKNQYRKFNIKTKSLTPGDDYGMMREVLTRRLTRLIKEEGGDTQGHLENRITKNVENGENVGNGGNVETPPSPHDDETPARPDLIILDGGKGQLSAALEVARELGLDLENDGPKIIAVANGRREDEHGATRPDRTASAIGEQVVMPGRDPFTLPPRDAGLFFLQQLRDEAHRFAIGAHRAKRKKAISANPVDDIPGVGAARKRALLNHFGSAKAIARAKPQDLAAVEGVSAALAERIYNFFHEK